MPSDTSATLKDAGPWSVKGVGPDAREATRDAARRAGMSVGEWLKTVIEDQARETEASSSQADQLSKLVAHLRKQNQPAASDRTADALPPRIEAALADGRQRTQAVEDKTAAALSSLMGWVEKNEALIRKEMGSLTAAQERTTLAVRDALSLVVSRLDAVEHRPRANQDEVAALRQAFMALEARLDVLDRQAREGVLQPHLASMLEDLEHRLTALASRMDAEEAARAASPPAPLPAADPAVGSKLDQIISRLPDPARASQAADATQSALDKVQSELARLTAKLDEPRPVAGMTQLQDAMADLASTVREVAPGPRLAAIEAGLTSLSGQVERIGPLPGSLGTVEAKLDHLASRLDDISDADRVADIVKVEMRERLTALHEIIATSQEKTVHKEDLEGFIDALATRIEEGRRNEADLARHQAASAPAPSGSDDRQVALPHVDERLAELSAKIQGLYEPDGIGGIRERLDEVQSMVGDALRATPDLGRIESLIRDLGQRIHGAPRREGTDRPTPGTAMTVAEKIAAAAAAAQTARAIGSELPKPPIQATRLPGDRALAFGMARTVTSRPAERPADGVPAAPDFIAAARRASQAAQEQGASRNGADGSDGSKLGKTTLLLSAGLLSVAIGSGAYFGLTDGGEGPAPQVASETVATPEPETVGAIGRVGSVGTAVVDQQVPPPLNDMQAAVLPKGLLRAARAGQPDAAYEVALRLLDGRGVVRDDRAAYKWFDFAARNGLAPAQYRVAAALEKGKGVMPDANQAKAWYLRAAEKGHVRAMHNLGVLFADGAGAAPDYATAAQWFRRAAEFGLRDSQYNLGILSARGVGASQNLLEAYIWFALAAAQGDEDSARKRDEVAVKLDAPTLARAKVTIAEFRPRTADSAANDVTPPAGGWDDVAGGQPPASPRS